MGRRTRVWYGALIEYRYDSLCDAQRAAEYAERRTEHGALV